MPRDLADMTDEEIVTAVRALPVGHFATFTDEGWWVEHDLACRLSGELPTCRYTTTVALIADEIDVGIIGRWRITDIDSEGLPSLERVDE